MTEDPFAVPSSAPSINKIPFLVFDAILVITAIALAFSAGGPLSPMLFFWILFCVIAGGLVACLPFWIEFRDKVRLSEYEIRERQNSIHDSQWQYVDARLVEQNEYLQKLHLRLSDSAERLASLEARPPTPTADEVAALCSSALQKQWPGWREELLSTLSRRTDILFNEQNAQSAKLSAVHEKRLAELRTEFTSVEGVLRGLETRVGEIALLAAAAGTAVATRSVQATVQGTQQSVAALASPDVAETASGAPAADGSGVADADTEATDDAVDLTVEDSLTFVPEDESVADEVFDEAEDWDASDADDTADWADASDLSDADDAADLADGGHLADADEGEREADPEAQSAEDAVASPESLEPPAAPLQPALLETPPPAARPKKAAPAEKTTLVAQVLIGIGNKPYVRGIGPGLSMEKGVPMQFVEIGKWEWVCPSGTTPVKIQIYKNDEIPSTLGEIELEPGQRKAVTPVFPR